MRNHYEILDVPRDATGDQIKAAYRFQLKAFHPDKFSQGSEHARSAQERIHQIVEAHRTLSEPSSRAEYDRFLHHTSPLAIQNAGTSAAKVRRRSGSVIYVSATDELESAEEITLAELAALGYGTMTRPSVEGESDLLPAIRKQIDRCRAVVQLVGRSFGEEPPTIDPTFGRVSYTQYEAMYARQHRKAVYYILLSDKFPTDAFAHEPDELSSLQKTYRRRLQIVDPNRCPVIDNSEALKTHLRALKGVLNTSSLAQWKNLLWVPMAAAIFVLVGVWYLPTKPSMPSSSSRKLETTLIQSEPSVAGTDISRPRESLALPPENISPTTPTTTAAPSTFDLPALARNARKAVVTVRVFDSKEKSIGTGTGFFISDDGRFVTNQHVIKDAVSAAVRTEDGAIYVVAGALARSTMLDLAVLKAEAKQVPFLRIQTVTPEIGSRIAIIGSPRALEGSLTDGIISAFREQGNGTWLQITAPVSPGSSGSPVLDSSGQVVGVATLNSSGRFQNLNFARSSHDLIKLLESIPTDVKPRLLSDRDWPKESAPLSASPAPNANTTYRVVGLPRKSPVLFIRKGPGIKFDVLAGFGPRGRGIILGPGRVTNGTTVWQEIFSGPYHGWVNAQYIEAETPGTEGSHGLRPRARKVSR